MTYMTHVLFACLGSLPAVDDWHARQLGCLYSSLLDFLAVLLTRARHAHVQMYASYRTFAVQGKNSRMQAANAAADL